MKYKLRYLPEAELDLFVIDDYLSQFYPDTPKKFFSDYDKAIETLLDMPYQYILYPGTVDFHRLIVHDFLAFYKINEDEHVITIHRILHGSQNISEKL